MMEKWKDIKGYEGLYQISNLGRVKSLPRIKYGRIKVSRETILVPILIKKDGYYQVNVYLNGIRKKFSIHRLVAQAFIPNPNNYPVVNHKDETQDNNNVDNLEWCTVAYNTSYGTAIERRTAKCIKTVYQYTKENEFIKEWDSAKQAEIKGGFISSHIGSCCNGKRNTHKGYKWYHELFNKEKAI